MMNVSASPSFASPDDHLHLRLFKIDLLAIDAGWNTQNVQSTFWRFYLNDRDGAALELPNGLYPLQADRAYFVPAGVRFHCRNVTPMRHFYAHFDVIGLPDVIMRELFAAPIALPAETGMRQAAHAILSAWTAPAPADLMLQCRVKSLLYEGLAVYLRDLPDEQRDRSNQLRRAIAPLLPAIERVEQNLAAPLSISCLAADCHLSANHFIRRFHACMGQTPARYIQERRIKAAAQRLLFTEESLDRIAEATGFGNRFYFSRVFTRHTGVSPAAYRKASRR